MKVFSLMKARFVLFLLIFKKNGVSYFSWCCIKSSLREGCLFTPRFKVQCVMAWKSWQQELEALYPQSASKELGTLVFTTLSPFHSIRQEPQAQTMTPHPSVSLIQIIHHRHAQRLVSWAILEPVRLTMLTTMKTKWGFQVSLIQYY